MPATRRIDCPIKSAEGDCCGVPYDTQLVSINGVNIHFWIGDRDFSVVKTLEQVARRHRDIVSVTFSAGAPTGYWQRADMGKRDALDKVTP